MDPSFRQRSGFCGLTARGSSAGGVIVRERTGLGIAAVLVFRHRKATLVQRVRSLFGIELPCGSSRHAVGELALLGVGPGSWLAMQEGAGSDLGVSLHRALGDLASVTDQSHGYAVLRLAGPHVRDTLCKLLPIDVHARAFKIGDVAVTSAAHVGATLWRLSDVADGSAVFEIAVPRSLAASFWRALNESAGEFGLADLTGRA